MRKTLVILVSTILTVLNINSYGELDPSVIEHSKSISLEQNGENNFFKNAFNWGFSSNAFKLIYFAEMLLISEVTRKT